MPPATFAPPSTELRHRIADTIRVLSIDAVQRANSGHPGLPMGGADFATVLATRHLRVDGEWPEWPGRDRFVLSAGHGSMLLYSMLHLLGFDVTLDDLREFRQWGSRTPGHPEYGDTAGVETTTGPLGQGVGNAVGMALAERMLATRFPGNPDGPHGHRTFCVAGDGCMMEGVASEAASLAGHLRLSRLLVWYDANDITIDGGTDLSFGEDVGARYRAYGWHVVDGVDAHDHGAIDDALGECLAESGRPSLVVGRSRIARGSPNKEGSHKAHGAPLGEDEVRLVKERLNFNPDESFAVPDDVREWFAASARAAQDRSGAWRERKEAWAESEPEAHAAWVAALERRVRGDPLAGAPEWTAGDAVPTRKAGNAALQVAAAAVPELVMGSADLFESNL
ncbi:MAG TPA: transketolase, partial [bacterium]|nr:transketolase [bacterium]